MALNYYYYDVTAFLFGTIAGAYLLGCGSKSKKCYLFNYDFWPAGFKCRKCLREDKRVCRSQACAYLKFKKVSAVVRSAKKSVDMCIALFTQRNVAEDLLKLQREGVKVRMIIDKELGKQGRVGSEVIQSLTEGGILVKKAEVNGLMHHKFVIMDGEILLNGSVNWTNSGFFGNYENIEICNDKIAIAAFNQEFNHLWDLL